MKVYKFFFNVDKEEQWLNEMAKRGYRLVGKSVGYEFVPGPPDRTTVKIDYRSYKTKEDFEDYKALFEDCGWTHVAGSRNSGFQYFRGAEGNEEIFSDTDSKAARYKKISQMWITLASTYIPIFAVLVSTDAIDAKALWNPKLLYLTPGLWERTGDAFWQAFLFETPFALFRGLVTWFFPLLIVLYLFFAHKADRKYRKTRT